ncbi:MAG: LytTR family DNA-binding domain-containing protein [Oscillospiraceae bacterium]|nr:LytTR family DNA-binding domain-containing protein [Oscillospiraceae bacterium]
MTNVLLCDDDSGALNKYARLITEIADKNHIEVMISTFFGGEELLSYLMDSHNSADIIYLDIRLGNVNGIDVAKMLRTQGCKADIVFLTGSESYVYDAFDIAPVQYLLKDRTTESKFEQVFLRAVSLASQRMRDMFIFESGGVSKMIPISEISFFEVWKRIVAVHYGGGETVKFYQTLERLQEELKDKDFIRIHRSYIINLLYIARFDKQSVFLKTGESLPIGGTYAKLVRQAFSEYAVRSHNLQLIK